MSTLIRSAACCAAFTVIAGCASVPPDGGFGRIADTARDRLGTSLTDAVRWQRTDADAAASREAVAPLLERPLSADDAVRIALLNNPGLQATYAELGIAGADVAAAGRMRNPHLSVLRTTRGGELAKAEDVFSLELMSLLTIPLRSKLEARRFERVQHEVAAAMLRTSGDARRAYWRAVASAELARYMAQALDAATAGHELANRMQRAGNVPKLVRMREQVFHAEVTTAVARARQTAVADRERLVRVLGLGEDAVKLQLADRLPDLPSGVIDEVAASDRAVRERLDVQAAQRETESTAASLGLTRATRFINVLELGRARTKEGDHPFAYGWEVGIEIPLFDWGSAKVARAEALYMQSAQRLAEVVVNARSEVREALAARTAAFEAAKRYRDEIVPLRRAISEEALLRYNGMLIGVFELLADARETIAAVSASIEALRDYWLAEADLATATTVGSPGATTAARAAMPVAAAGGH